MIDPMLSLAFSIQANRNVYALLLGSGVSRAARIPTGWEVTIDLIRKLARLCDEVCDPDPERWYQERFGTTANYSDLLDEIAKTPAERHQLLRSYVESNDQDREEGDKQPTAAHRAIAALVARGFIRVIITTNFDRLVETSVQDEGIVPTILSSSDQVDGALPLIHTNCCVFKLHGDYLDTRIRNTPAELDQYPRQFDQLLDRIFDEFGLIVCGWSAEWDGALRSAFLRCPSRRFTTYWAVKDEPGIEANRLITHRRAQVISINEADEFFATVQQHVESIEAYSRPHPLSTEAAVASLKRYIPDSRYRIQLSDLMQHTVERVVEGTSGEAFSLDAPTPTRESTTRRVRHYEAVCSTLLAMATIGGYWAEVEHYHVWQRALERLGSTTSRGGISLWLFLRQYPATLLLYALGLGAVVAGRLQFLNHIFSATMRREHEDDLLAVQILPPECSMSTRPLQHLLEGMDRHYLPLNDWIHETFRPYGRRIAIDDSHYTMAFDELEILMALSYIHHSGGQSRLPHGSFVFRHANRNRILNKIKQSVSTERDDSPYVTCRTIGETVATCEHNLEIMEQVIANRIWY